jgi:hypothetical protein
MEKDRNGVMVGQAPPSADDALRSAHRGSAPSQDIRSRVEALCADLDPVRLLAEIRELQGSLTAIADGAASRDESRARSDRCIPRLRVTWQAGEAPTAQSNPTPS